MARIAKILVLLFLFTILTSFKPERCNKTHVSSDNNHYNTTIVTATLSMHYLLLYDFCYEFIRLFLKSKAWEVQSSHSNKLYVGIDNYLSLTESQKLPDSFSVSTDNGYIFREGDQYIFIPSEKGEATIYIHAHKDGKKELINSECFTAEYLPKPSLTINGHSVKNNSVINKRILMAGDQVGVCIISDLKTMEKCYEIKNFEFGSIYGNHYISYVNKGNTFNSRTKGMIARLMPAQTICVRVKYKNESNMVIKGKPYRFLITV